MQVKINARSKNVFSGKKLIVFDMDGTLTKSKSDLDAHMARLIKELLCNKMVAVIGGGRYKQFQKQFLAKLKIPKKQMRNLFLFPTNATAFYRYHSGWKEVYAKTLPLTVRKKIFGGFRKAFKETQYVHPLKVFGRVIEDRGTQVTFSALGQQAPGPLKQKLKKEWIRNRSDPRPSIAKALKKYVPGFELRLNGMTSIDITKKGIDKAYGIHQIEKKLHIPRKNMLFVGDAIFPGGNDYAVVRTGVDYMKVKDPEETKKIIRQLI